MSTSMDLKPMFSPKSIAIIGASGDRKKFSAVPLFRLRDNGYQGEVYPVNPKYQEIAGYPCFKDIESLPENIDLAILAIRGSEVLPALQKLAKRSIKSVVVFSNGFSEIGEEGKRAQQQLSEFVKSTGIPVCGPNSLGLFNLREGVLATFVGSEMNKSDPLACVTQSGAFGINAYKMLGELGHGFQCYVSTGNEAGTDFFDYIQYFVQQPEIKAIGGYLEGVRDRNKMDRALQLSQIHEKPIVLMKVGSSERGAEAASSHTASLAGNFQIYKTYFQQHNVIQVQDEDELADTLAVFNKAKASPIRGGVAIITDSGGAGIVMADKCGEYGLRLADLSQETKAKLKQLLPPYASIKNPIDVTTEINGKWEQLKESIAVVLEDEQVESVIFHSAARKDFIMEVLPRLSEVASKSPKTFIMCWSGVMESTKQLLNESGLCWLPTPSRAVRAIKNLMVYHQRKEDYLKKNYQDDRLTNPVLLEPHSGTVNEFIGKDYLARYGISIPVGRIAHDRGEAEKAAEWIGYPVVLKAVSEQIAHKSEADVVKINLRSADEVKKAYDEILHNAQRYNPQAKIEGVLVEKMIEDGIEVMIGSVQDELFGPCILFGLGGIFVEVLKDVVMMPAPLTIEQAHKAIQSIKGYPILKGVRGKGPYDIDELAKTMVKVSEFCLDQQFWLQELDINPILVHKEGKGVTALDSLMIGKPVGESDDHVITGANRHV